MAEDELPDNQRTCLEILALLGGEGSTDDVIEYVYGEDHRELLGRFKHGFIGVQISGAMRGLKNKGLVSSRPSTSSRWSAPIYTLTPS